MLKVSVHLTDGTKIDLEASDISLAHEMMELALKELPRELFGISQRIDHVMPKSIGTIVNQGLSLIGEGKNVEESEMPETIPDGFDKFCQDMAPIGDMRRTVVAAIGAERYLTLKCISPAELKQLFDLAGWSQPPNFIQTLRNAARSKFRWMERVPGKPGYYSPTSTGIAAVRSVGAI